MFTTETVKDNQIGVMTTSADGVRVNQKIFTKEFHTTSDRKKVLSVLIASMKYALYKGKNSCPKMTHCFSKSNFDAYIV